MLSDYLSRQVIGARHAGAEGRVGPADSQLAMLVSVVSLVVGVLTVPISLVADRWGRVKSITLMAFVWCLATVACGLAQSHGQLLWARAFVGLGEAAYGAAGARVAGACVSRRGSAPRCWAPSFRPACSARCSASSSAAPSRPSPAGAWPSSSSARRACCWPLIYPFVVRDYKTVALTSRRQGWRRAEALDALAGSRAKCSARARATSPTLPAACRWPCRPCSSPGCRPTSAAITTWT